MEYRDVKYEYENWITYSGKEAHCYSCSDKNLLDGLGLKYISDKDEVSIKKSIDFYIAERPRFLRSMELERKATEVFYETLTYKGD